MFNRKPLRNNKIETTMGILTGTEMLPEIRIPKIKGIKILTKGIWFNLLNCINYK